MRSFPFVLVAVSFVPFVACGGGSPQPSAPTTTPTTMATTEPTTTSSPTPTTTDTPSSSDSTPAASASATTATSSSTPGPLPIVAFRIVATDGKKNVLYDVKADGTIQDADGKPMGKNDGHAIKDSESGDALFTVDDDGTVHGDLFKGTKAKFDDKDVLVVVDGKTKMTVTVDDAGNVTALGPKGKDAMPWKVVGSIAQAKRTAALLSLTIARPKKK